MRRSWGGPRAGAAPICSMVRTNANMFDQTFPPRAMRSVPSVVLALLAAVASPSAAQRPPAAGARFAVSFPAVVRGESLTGRVFVFVTMDSSPEPRFQAGEIGLTAPFFGRDVSALAPSATVIVDASAQGFPLHSVAELPEGDYYVQAVANVYTRFDRADGHSIWVHMDQWEGHHLTSSPGNLFSDARRVHIAAGRVIPLRPHPANPPVTGPEDPA